MFLAGALQSHAAETYFTGFESFTAGDDTIIGTDSWTGSYSGKKFHGVMTEAQHGVAGIGNAAFVGGYSTTVAKGATGSSVYVARPVNIDPIALNQEIATFSVVFGIKDSSVTKRDNFEFLIYNQSNVLLGGIQFDNSTLDSTTSKPRRLIYRLSWNASTSTYQYVLTDYTFLSETLETLTCRINFKTSVWTVSLSDVPIFENVPFYTGTGTMNLGFVMAKMAVTSSTASTISPGDNYMLFDDYTLRTDSPAPAIAVEQPASTILTSGTSTVDFGASLLGNPVSKTFTIRNEGDAELSGISATIDGTNPSDFAISPAPPASVAVGGSATFTVTFTPSASGGRAADLHIASNDADSTPFNVALAGTGLDVPEISVEQPAGTDHTDGTANVGFGNVTLGSNASRTFTIKNTGGADLTGVSLSKGGTNADEFTVTSSPSATVAGSGSTTFTVRFTPAASGTRTAAIHIASNDSNENPFDITLSGSGVALPEITIKQPEGKSLIDGVSTRDFGSRVVKTMKGKTFTIINDGTAVLNKIAITKTGKQAKDFIIVGPSSKSLLPGDSTKFKVVFNPSAKGKRKAVIHVASNDLDEKSFDFTVTGKGIVKSSSAVPLSAVAMESRDPASSDATIGSFVRIGGLEYRCLTIRKTPALHVSGDSVEVSPNLVDWFSGSRHTSVMQDDAEILKVRDIHPCDALHKRYIRLRP